MKIFTIHSESHQELFNIMKESLEANCKDYELISKVVPQVSKTVDYGKGDSLNFKHLKVLHILELLYTEKEPFIFADVDIYFFRDFAKDLEGRLGDNDFIAQFEKYQFGFNTVCSGFMYMQPNEKMKKAYKWILYNLHRFKGDQVTLNRYLLTHRLKYKSLPKEYYSINYDNGNKVWNGEDIKVSVENPFLIHLHWTLGMDNRIKLLEMVKNKYD